MTKTIAFIPARGGSKGLPGKNIIDFHGKPLINYTIAAALDSLCFDKVLVSTDSQQIADIAAASGAKVPWLRPAHLCTDEATTMDAVLHALDNLPADTVVVLQPTSPLRTAEDIRICVEMHRESGKTVVSVTEAKPWVFAKAGNSLAPAFDFAARRQDAEYVTPNGAIYVFSADYVRSGRQWWFEALPYLMPADRSIDIDTSTDLVIAKALYANR